jgi:hypothetical protein
MGLRVRLKASFDISNYSARMQVILRTMKRYGLIMSDNGSNWYFQGTHDDRWDDDDINTLKGLHGSDFEAVDISSWLSRPGFDPASGKVPPAPGAVVARHNNQKPSMLLTIRGTGKGEHNYTTVISFVTQKAGRVSAAIFDASGKMAVRLYDGSLAAGQHTFTWDAPATPRAGVYIIRIAGPDETVRSGTLVITR